MLAFFIMWSYIFRRIFYSIPILIGVNFITFALFFIVNTPDDMARVQLGTKYVTQADINSWKEQKGYNKPLFFNESVSGMDKLTDTIFYQKSAPLFQLDLVNQTLVEISMKIFNKECGRLWLWLFLVLSLHY